MKNIKRYSYLCLLALLSNACLEDSGELADIANIEAATLVVNTGGTVTRGVTDEITFPVDFTAQSNEALVESVDLILNFSGLNNTVENRKVTSLTSLPADVRFTTDELLSQAGLTMEELSAGDSWTYSYVLNNTAGSTWQVLGETRYTLICPSDLAGRYNVVSSGTSTDACCPDEITDFMSIIELTELRPGVYQMNDFSGGLYYEWYDVYGLTGPDDSPGRLEHICGAVNVIETTEPFGTAVTGSGNYDAETGVITYSWVNGYDDIGTVTLTPM